MKAVALLSLLAVLAVPAGAAELFRLDDPRGDDRGDGSLRYPLNYYDLAPGDLDLVSFAARKVKGGTELEVAFAAPVRKPTGRPTDLGGGRLDELARFGFYGVNVDIYIDTDHTPGSGGIGTLPGRKARLAPETAWEKAVILTPRPHEARSSLRRAMLNSLRQELEGASASERGGLEAMLGQVPGDVERHVFFPTRIRVVGRSIRFFVPAEFLGGEARADWSYVVFTSGADVDQRFTLPASVGGSPDEGLFILPARPGGAPDRFGGNRDNDRGQPPIVDLLTGQGTHQAAVLSDYEPNGERTVELPGVVPEAEKK
jgi:hypothetical protein